MIKIIYILSSFLFSFKFESIGPCSREALGLEEHPQLAAVWLSDASVPVWLLHPQFSAHCTSYVLQWRPNNKINSYRPAGLIILNVTVSNIFLSYINFVYIRPFFFYLAQVFRDRLAREEV